MNANTWASLFDEENKKEYAQQLHQFLNQQYVQFTIYPPRKMMFKAFELTPLSKVKVVIIGQDPYHQPKQAMGLCFSVPKDIALPKSLINIYKEIETDLNVKMNYQDGDLSFWATQGVLLLNAILTVRKGEALSHHGKGYETFLKTILMTLNKLDQPIVFLLWGNFARGLKKYLNNKNHLILESVHPSPLAANQGGWFNNHHFSQTNHFLRENNVQPIKWHNT
jgi:uracil-DNA glycosylase